MLSLKLPVLSLCDVGAGCWKHLVRLVLHISSISVIWRLVTNDQYDSVNSQLDRIQNHPGNSPWDMPLRNCLYYITLCLWQLNEVGRSTLKMTASFLRLWSWTSIIHLSLLPDHRGIYSAASSSCCLNISAIIIVPSNCDHCRRNLSFLKLSEPWYFK